MKKLWHRAARWVLNGIEWGELAEVELCSGKATIVVLGPEAGIGRLKVQCSHCQQFIEVDGDGLKKHQPRRPNPTRKTRQSWAG